jgi:hypothetical protein
MMRRRRRPKKERKGSFTFPLLPDDRAHLFQVLSEKRFGFFPGILRRCLMIAWALVTKKAVSRLGIDLRRKVPLFVLQFRFDLIDMIHWNQRIFGASL